MSVLKKTALYNLHLEKGAKMVPFAGYEMPVSYPMGIIAEHNQVRQHAGLFDVSHMGQIILRGGNVAAELEKLVPGDIQILKPNQQRYTLFTLETGGILDDLMVANMGDHLFLVVNAACKEQDAAHLRAHLPSSIKIEELPNRSLIALQGPEAAKILEKLIPGISALKFMYTAKAKLEDIEIWLSRSGYTGEDGFELSIPNEAAEKITRLLLNQPGVAPIGLGARDTLRLEAGLCLYGHDIKESTSPVAANLAWVINKRRKLEGGFLGADKILAELAQGAPMLRVGLKLDGRAMAREGAEIVDGNEELVGYVTSGSFGPTVNAAISMGYVQRDLAVVGTLLFLKVRGQSLPARVVDLPFTPHRYYRS
ncbi:MAG: glycine cleavage system aminomethyltransferase GcvT [Dongiaceae bacterium]